MEEYTVCNACGENTFILYGTSGHCTSCDKTYHFNPIGHFSYTIPVVKEMADD